jgi:hypothetical protein
MSARKSSTASVCVCGHTVYWHSHDGAGDCEGVNLAAPGSFVPCECEKFAEGNYACRNCGAVVAWEGELPEDCLRCGEPISAGAE